MSTFATFCEQVCASIEDVGIGELLSSFMGSIPVYPSLTSEVLRKQLLFICSFSQSIRIPFADFSCTLGIRLMYGGFIVYSTQYLAFLRITSQATMTLGGYNLHQTTHSLLHSDSNRVTMTIFIGFRLGDGVLTSSHARERYLSSTLR